MNTICKKLFTLFALAWGMTFIAPSVQASIALAIYSCENNVPDYVIVLEEKPVVTFTDGGLHITASNDYYTTADFILPFEKMPRFTFEEANQTQDVEETEVVPVPFRFEFTDGNTVRINGTERVSVYGIDGRQRQADIEQRTNGVSVNLELLPKGYYIIKTEKQSFKIYKK